MTTLTATPQPATPTRPPSMLLQVAAAPNPPAAAYSSNFAAGVDGWVNGGSATLTGNVTVPGGTAKSLQIDGPASLAEATAQRALAGLTVATPYRYKATATIGKGEIKLVAKDTASGTVLAQTSFVTFAAPSNKTLQLQLDFTPTAGAVTIQAVIRQTSMFMSSTATVYLYNVTVLPTGAWLGTTVYRTDVNGVDVPVREDIGGQDVAGGVMTLTDWEAALVGLVTYRVVDGLGASVVHVPVTHAPELRRNVYTNPSLSVDSTSWAAVPQLSGTMSSARLTVGGPVVDGRALNYFRAQWATISTGGIGSTGLTFGHPTTTYLPVGAGVPFAVAVYARSNVANRGAQLVVTFHDAAGAQLAVMSSAASTPIGGNVWTLLEASTLLTPAGTVRAYARVYATTGANWVVGDTIDATGVLPAAAPGGSYFDGDSPDVGARQYGWLGTPGASASVELGELAGPAWLQLPATAVPSAGDAGAPSSLPVQLVTDYDGAAESVGELQDVIGRADPVGSPGVLSTRRGTLQLWEADYAAARAVRQLLAAGDVALLRQPAHAGLDLFMVAGRVVEQPQDETTAPLRWSVALEYREVKP